MAKTQAKFPDGRPCGQPGLFPECSPVNVARGQRTGKGQRVSTSWGRSRPFVGPPAQADQSRVLHSRGSPTPGKPGGATGTGGGVVVAGCARMGRPLGQCGAHVPGSTGHARPSQAWALSGFSSQRAQELAQEPFQAPRTLCARRGPWLASTPPHPHALTSACLRPHQQPLHLRSHHHGTPAPTSSPPRGAPVPRTPRPSLSLPPSTCGCGCGWFPGAATLLCRTLPAAGSPCDMPGAPPARPASAPCPRGCLRALSRSGHPRAAPTAPRQPRPLGLPALPAPPRVGRVSQRASPGSGPSRPTSAPPSFSHPRLVSSSARPLSAPRGPKSTPAATFRRRPALRGSHVVALKPQREREAHPREATPRWVGARGAPCSLWGPSTATGELRLRNTVGVLGSVVFSRSHRGIFLRLSHALRPPPGAGVTVPGHFLRGDQSSGCHSGSSSGPGAAALGRGRRLHRVPPRTPSHERPRDSAGSACPSRPRSAGLWEGARRGGPEGEFPERRVGRGRVSRTETVTGFPESESATWDVTSDTFGDLDLPCHG